MLYSKAASGNKIVILKWYVPGSYPNPVPGTTTIPVSSNNLKQ